LKIFRHKLHKKGTLIDSNITADHNICTAVVLALLMQVLNSIMQGCVQLSNTNLMFFENASFS